MFTNFVQGLKKNLSASPPVYDEVAIWQQFQHWYASPLGQRLAETEKQLLDRYLPNLFGYYLLQCGNPVAELGEMSEKWLQNSRVPSRFIIDYVLNQQLSCVSYHDRLPVKSDSLDLVILPHTLDFAVDPHLVLREVERVLIPEGHVVILSFSALSSWNLCRKLPLLKQSLPQNAQFFSAYRIMDWLGLLGFDVIHRRGYFQQLPLQNEKLHQRSAFLTRLGQRLWPNLGAGYMLVARKRVETLTPIRPRWRARRRVVTGLEPLNRKRL